MTWPVNKVATTADLCRGAIELVGMLPANIRGVIGVPRTGMIPAGIVAEHRHVPLGTLDSFLNLVDGAELWLTHGVREPKSDPGPIVVIDDSASSAARTMLDVRRLLHARLPSLEFLFAAIFAPPGTPGLDFVVYQPLPDRWWQEHNLLLGDHAPLRMADLDGVICEDPNINETDDQAFWFSHFADARPKLLPRWLPLYAIVTSRLEKYRWVTEDWIARYGCKYERLLMVDAPNVATRDRWIPGSWPAQGAALPAIRLARCLSSRARDSRP